MALLPPVGLDGVIGLCVGPEVNDGVNGLDGGVCRGIAVVLRVDRVGVRGLRVVFCLGDGVGEVGFGPGPGGAGHPSLDARDGVPVFLCAWSRDAAGRPVHHW